MTTQICTQCGQEKDLCDYYYCKSRGRYVRKCKSCHKLYNDSRKKEKAQWHKNNKDRITAKRNKWKQENREEYLARKRIGNSKRKDAHNEYCKKWVIRNKESRQETSRKYYVKNKTKITERAVLYQNKRRKNDPPFRLQCSLRSQIIYALRNGGTKNKRTYELLGASVGFVKKHLESQFKDGMSWDNYGLKGWHVDHIYPCSKFDLTDPEEQKKCFHWSNLQPMWAFDNKSKGDKVTCEKPDFVLEYCE